mmetsp:Transcript_20745/g.41504  ORF Transcript_20745/g.41504 Transcript_20745/m.41504 type:complete len:82 (-) Transcript_20745:172-417(-)
MARVRPDDGGEERNQKSQSIPTRLLEDNPHGPDMPSAPLGPDDHDILNGTSAVSATTASPSKPSRSKSKVVWDDAPIVKSK